MLRNKKSILVVGVLAVIISACAATNTGGPSTNGKFKNLKVLPKDITEDQLDHLMKGFNAALGVKCNFCHVRNEEAKKMEFEKDDKPEKETARMMYKMSMDINKEHFGFGKNGQNVMAVTCYTCHNGEAHPATEAPKKGE